MSFKDRSGTLKLLLTMGKSYDFVKIKCSKKMNCFTRATEVLYVLCTVLCTILNINIKERGLWVLEWDIRPIC